MEAGWTRRSFLAGGALAALGAAGGLARPWHVPSAFAAPGRERVARAAVVGSPPLRDAGYWEFADWLQVALDRLWNESHTSYTTDTRLTACVLMTHSIAALKGHDGRSRDDARARQLAARLCESPPYRPAPNGRPTQALPTRGQRARRMRPAGSAASHAPTACST